MNEETIARPYAKALFLLALEKNKVDLFTKMLHTFTEVINNKNIRKLLHNPFISIKDWVELFKHVTGNVFIKEGENLLLLLLGKKRLAILPAIATKYDQLVDEHEKKMPVKIVSAYSLNKERLEKIKKILKKHLQREILLDFVVDRSILGGAIIYAGDQMIDGSLRGKINRLSEILCSS
jgi:F-type H+-transporting ATPase subunit delta